MMVMNLLETKIFVGLDLSLTETGYAVIEKEGGILKAEKWLTGNVKTKKMGDSAWEEIERLEYILTESLDYIGKSDSETKILVGIEGLAFMAKKTTALAQLAALNYLVRHKLYGWKIPFVIVAPMTLKKFVTGKGKGDKNLMLLEVYKKWSVDIKNDNEADAFGLARLMEYAVDQRQEKPIKELKKYESEVLQTIKPQLDFYATK